MTRRTADRLLAALTVTALAGGLAGGWWASRLPADADDAAPADPAPVVAARVEGLPVDHEPVVGVTVDGCHRAYPLSQLLLPSSHVFNDTIGLAPVTVTFCNLENCVRVFTDPRRDGTPLAVVNAGATPLRPKGMQLAVGDDRYDQKTGQPVGSTSAPFPYPDLPVERTTWGAWRAKHPDSDVLMRGQMLGGSRRP